MFDFDNNIYDKNIELFFYKQIRQRKKRGIKELLNQINLDIAEAKKILNCKIKDSITLPKTGFSKLTY